MKCKQCYVRVLPANRQAGMTMVEMVLSLLFICMLGIFAISLVPPIVENIKVNQIVSDVVHNLRPEARTSDQLIDSIEKRFAAENITTLAPKEILKIRDDSLFSATTDYEVRRPFLGPLNMVIHFNKTFKP